MANSTTTKIVFIEHIIGGSGFEGWNIHVFNGQTIQYSRFHAMSQTASDLAGIITDITKPDNEEVPMLQIFVDSFRMVALAGLEYGGSIDIVADLNQIIESLGNMDKLIITSYADMIAWPRNAIHEGASNEHAKAQLKKVCHILGQYGQ